MQESKLYVGNLKYSVTPEQLQQLFADYGEVKHVNIIEGRGFGFVECADSDQAEKAKEALNGSEYEGRTMRIDIARSPKRRNNNERRGNFRNDRRF
jgi:RNA recognition motif-containing protein